MAPAVCVEVDNAVGEVDTLLPPSAPAGGDFDAAGGIGAGGGKFSLAELIADVLCAIASRYPGLMRTMQRRLKRCTPLWQQRKRMPSPPQPSTHRNRSTGNELCAQLKECGASESSTCDVRNMTDIDC